MSEGTSHSAGSIKSTGTSVESAEEDLVVLFDRENDHDDLEEKHERHERHVRGLKRHARFERKENERDHEERKHRHEKDLMNLGDSDCNGGRTPSGKPCSGTSTSTLVNLMAHAKATKIMNLKAKKNMFLY